MPFKPKTPQPDFSSLVTSLDNSTVQVSNYSLYQTILFLIKNTQKARDLLVADIKTLDQELSEIFAGSFLTINLETNDFPNSRQLLAGTGIAFDDTVAGKRTINGTAVASQWEVLTNGDAVNPELIYAGGDVIMLEI